MDLATFRGDWALVTGASSGIGREFALKLAETGLNVVVVARREQRLEELAALLRRSNAIRTKVIALDLASAGAAEALKDRLTADGCRIRLLCNNAAFGHWGRFEKASQASYQSMVQVNVGTLVATCFAFFADLKSFPSSVVINVSSAAALQPVPYLAVYAATKAFVQSFGQALHGEWKEHGILVQTLVPGPTETEFDRVAGAYASALTKRGSAADVVSDALAALGRDDPVAFSAKGTLTQRMFAGLAPPRLVIREVAKRFRPPE
ncbi:MAG TPA: SDR family NAD(P)-dependent oxidoreductase [Casimicrobiaceae bacterium]|nr:SDR family NAD(P)-dependent oxidoreductase [Casimicrobiaceae bacterium]